MVKPFGKGKWSRSTNPNILTPNQRQTAAKLALMKISGMSAEDISQETGYTVKTIKAYLCRAAMEGLFKPVDPADTLEYRLSHKIVANIEKALDGDDMKATQQEMTIQGAKGLGLFKTYDSSKTEQQTQMTALTVRIESPEGGSAEVRVGTIGGTPAYSQGDK